MQSGLLLLATFGCPQTVPTRESDGSTHLFVWAWDNVPVRSGRFWVQPVGTTGSLVVLDVSRPEAPVIVDELPFGVDARPHWLALEPGGKRMVMTGGGTAGRAGPQSEGRASLP